MDILAAVIIFTCALVACFACHVLVFSRKASGQVSGIAYGVYLAVIFAAGILFNLLLFFMV